MFVKFDRLKNRNNFVFHLFNLLSFRLLFRFWRQQFSCK